MTTIVKIGGNVVDNPEALGRFLQDFASLPGPKALVHGGGKEATRLSRALGIETVMIDGRRVTDAATIDVVTMVYAGLINKRIVSKLQALGCNALGLSGADCMAIEAHKRPAKPLDYGFVGDIDRINAPFINSLLEQGITPVFCAITCDAQGQLLNSNADSVASAVAQALAQTEPTRLVYCFEKPGVLSNPDDDNSWLPQITPANYAQLKAAGAISGGMIPKIDNALAAVAAGVESVAIKSAANLSQPIGTIISH